MLKVLSLMKRKEGMSYAEFRNWALNEHPPFAKKLPGLKGYRMNVPLTENPDSPEPSRLRLARSSRRGPSRSGLSCR